MFSIGKQRLDKVLISKGLRREEARGLILAGVVRVDGCVIEKAGAAVSPDACVSFPAPSPYVSRGGVKLEAALEAFEVAVSGRVCMDVGASTGGFTDCLLHRGATKVYAIDVGYGQLAWSLRTNPNVILLERANIRLLPKTALSEAVDLAVIDVSFISLEKVLPCVTPFLMPHGEIIALLKPQFEVGKGEVGKGGIVRDEQQHRAVLDRIKTTAIALGLTLVGTMPSPILGKKGNKEFLLHMQLEGKAPRLLCGSENSQ